MKPIKVLFVHGGTLEKAGTEAYMMSVFDTVNPNEIHIDFLVFGCKEGYYDAHVLENGSKIFRIPLSPKEMLHQPSKRKVLKAIELESYDIVHSHMNALSSIIFYYADTINIPIKIAHSHGSKHFVNSKILEKGSNVFMHKIPKYADVLISCSQAAGDFLYEEHPYTIINNGIDLPIYAYHEENRVRIRSDFNWDDRFVLGHVGRFNFQKNHAFLIDIFAAVHAMEPRAHLILIGEGELEADIRKKVADLGLEEKVEFLGLRNDVPNLLQAMDVFVLPSVFEGLPYVLVEAQASGLPCIVANTIDTQSHIIDAFQFLPLEDPKRWADWILSFKGYHRKNETQILIDKGFDVRTNVQVLTDIYKEQIQKKHR